MLDRKRLQVEDIALYGETPGGLAPGVLLLA
jgi:hypothetical protein